MPHIIENLTTSHAIHAKLVDLEANFDKRFSEEHIHKATALQIWGSSVDDAGADYCDVVLLSGQHELDRVRIPGY